MTHSVIINGTDIASAHGIKLTKGSYANLIQWPSLKAVTGNDWQEYDGFEPDLSNPVLDGKTLTLSFVMPTKDNSIVAFYHLLGSTPVGSYGFLDIGYSANLRLLSMPSLDYGREFHLLECQFADDTPLSSDSYAPPYSSLRDVGTVYIDGTPISAYGVKAIKGTIGSCYLQPDVKPLLSRNISTVPGVIYDPNGTVTYKRKDISIVCQMEDTISSFWRNYKALLLDLVKIDEQAEDPVLKGARTVSGSLIPGAYKCWYNSQKVTDLAFDGNSIWLKFELTLTAFSYGGNS